MPWPDFHLLPPGQSPTPWRERLPRDFPTEYVVRARVLETLAVRRGERVLEMGTGSGYGAAVLSRLGARVYTVKLAQCPAISPENPLWRLGLWPDQVKTLQGDLQRGWPDEAPFDAILINCPVVDVPPALLRQLRPHGRVLYCRAGPTRSWVLRRNLEFGPAELWCEVLPLRRK